MAKGDTPGIKQYHIRLPEVLAQRMELLVAITDARKHGRLQNWFTRLVEKAVEEGLAKVGGVHLWLRPHGSIYGREPGCPYTLLAQGAGGERVWIIGSVDDLPTGKGWRVDITSEGGFDGRGVYIGADDILGDRPKT